MHPNRQELNDFAIGLLNEDSFEQVADHVDTCVACGDTVRELESAPNDPLIREIRGPRPEPEFEQEPECEQLVAIVQEIQPADSADSDVIPAEGFADTEPRSLGPYQFMEKLGQGGMGTVYKARHEHLDRLFAVKLLPPDRLGNAGIVGRFRREMKAVGRLSHPNIVQATDAGEAEGMHYLVMELVEGIDVARLARRNGPLAIADACEIVRQAAVGVAHAHQHSMVHRDIKPANLMLTRTVDGDVQVKVLDLGLALLHETDSTSHADLTAASHIMGTVEYMAPEQGIDSHEVDRRADVYSLGVTLYKLLSGRTPFPADRHGSTLKLMMAKANGPAPSLAGFRDDFPTELVDLVGRMIARDPDERVPSADVVALALAPFATGHALGRLLDTVSETGAPSDSDDPQAFSPTVTPDDVPTPALAEKAVRGPSNRRTLLSVLTATVGLAAMLAIAIFYFKVGDTTIAVEIHDDQAEVTAAGDTLRITKHDKSGDAITVKPGEQTLHVTRGDLQFDTDSFVLRRGDKISVSVKVVGGELHVLRDGKVIGRGDLQQAADNRRVAEMVLSLGGQVSIGGDTSIARPEDLPNKPFDVVTISLVESSVVDDDLRLIANLPKLTTLSLARDAHPSRLTDEGLAHLKKLPELKTLDLSHSQITNGGLQNLRRFPKLFRVSLSDTQVSDDGLRHLAGLSELFELYLYRTKVTGTGFRHLTNCTKLEQLDLQGSPLSDDGFLSAPQLPRLRVLRVDTTPLTNRGLQRVARYRESLEEFWAVRMRNVTEDGWKVLSELRQLKKLVLAENGASVTDGVVARIAVLPKLEELYIPDSVVTDAGLRHLYGWGSDRQKPVTLNVQRTKVTIDGIAALKATLPPSARIGSDFTDAEIDAAMAKLKADTPEVPEKP